MIESENSIVQYVIQIKNGMIIHINLNVKLIVRAKKNYSWNPSTYICENSKYLKSITDPSMTGCNEIIIVVNNVSTKKTIKTNVTTTASINCHSIKVRDYYILHTILLPIILLLIIIIICYHYAIQKGIIQNGK